MSYSNEFNFEDGNIILRVTSPPKDASEEARITLFRVHKSILRMQSDVFDGMMAIPQPPATSDDLPEVDLYDKEEQVRNMLVLIYHPEWVPDPSDWFIDMAFIFLASAMPLLRKYQMDRLLKFCMNRVRRYYPELLFDWDARETWKRVQTSTHVHHAKMPWESEAYACQVAFDPVRVIELCRDFPELERMEAVAFYDLSRQRHDYFDITNTDGREGIGLYSESGGVLTDWQALTAHEWRRLWHGTNSMRSSIRSAAFNPKYHLGHGGPSMPSELEHTGCPAAEKTCKLISDLLLESVTKSHLDPLTFLKEVGEDFMLDLQSAADEECIVCRRQVGGYLLGYRHVLWNSFYKWFCTYDY
ncbi:hypothetical protein FRB90_003465 [Tulasnella sp. 427]|nr:hypothetical protein FRB90_003465 [Tulasnella sp. 427]